MKRHRSNKIAGVLMAVALLASLVAMLAGCANTTTTPAATTTTTTTRTTPANPELIMSSTTSTGDSGLMEVLIPMFEQQTGYKVKPIYVGTGAALAMGERGEADVILVHAPTSEVAFMQAGHGINRQLVMHNDFIIVGPAADPAGIKGMTSALDSMKKIAASSAVFISRGDDSGTNKLELTLWGKAGITPEGQSWYQESGQGMGATLTIASEKEAYTITDRATYLATQDNLELDILVDGDPVLLNIYHVIQVNPNKSADINAAGAEAFVNFMISPATQEVIRTFGVAEFGEPLFFPDADKTEADLGSV
jgi:tungstate transport system substrate-binding protein